MLTIERLCIAVAQIRKCLRTLCVILVRKRRLHSDDQMKMVWHQTPRLRVPMRTHVLKILLHEIFVITMMAKNRIVAVSAIVDVVSAAFNKKCIA